MLGQTTNFSDWLIVKLNNESDDVRSQSNESMEYVWFVRNRLKRLQFEASSFTTKSVVL